MLKKSWKSWVSERYAKTKVEERYEQEKDTTIALLEKQKEELEQSLSRYDLENTTIDYDGITSLFFEGDYVHATTRGERYTIRLKDSTDVFEFIKRLCIPNSHHSFIGQDTWILSTRLSPNVDEKNIPKLDFIRIDDAERVRLLLDLSKEIDLASVKGIVDALHGVFSVSMNYEQINEALVRLGEELNAWMKGSFKLKFDASDVRAFTFYAENDEGDTVDLSSIGTFDVERLLLDREGFMSQLKSDFAAIRNETVVKLDILKSERIKEAAFNQAQTKLSEMHPLVAKVNVIYDKNKPIIDFQTVHDTITIQADAEMPYFELISNVNQLKTMLRTERKEIQQFIEMFDVKVNAERPFCLKDGYVNASIDAKNASLLIKEVNERHCELVLNRLQNWIKQEQPTVQEVLNRFTLVQGEVFNSYSFVDGTIHIFITSTNYQNLIKEIRHALMQNMEFELSEEYKRIPNINAALFGVTINQSYANSNFGPLNVVTIEKTDGTYYKKYFKDGFLIASHLIDEIKII